MKRLLFPFLLGAAAWLAPGRSQAQNKPALNTAPPGSLPPTAPAPTRPRPTADTTSVAPTIPVYTPATTPTTPAQPQPAQPSQTGALPPPSAESPSGLELPGREQERKAAQQHAEQYTKLFIYSGLGLGYSSNYYSDGGVFNFSISPAIGYRINDRLAIGPGISYTYVNYSFGKNNPSLNLNNIGVKVFGQFRVIDQFFVHAEYEVTKAELPLVDQNNNYVIVNNRIATGTRQVQSPLAGVGYRSQISNRAAADIVLLYNFQDGYNSIYSNPVIRFNFLFNIGH
ncbi:MAG: hypothetical protein ACRYG7_38620 [Janthinobacterium lividum]